MVPSFRWGALVAFGIASSACVKTSATFQVRDPGAVGVSTTTVQGVSPLLPPDGADRSVIVPLYAQEAVTLVRQRHQIVMFAGGGQAEIVDGWGMLPPIARGRGAGVRDTFLDVHYTLAGSRLLPFTEHPDGSIPIIVSTDLTNVADARLVHEPRRWPAYVLLPLGGLSALLGGAMLSERRNSDFLDGGTFYLVASVPLIVLGLVSALSSTSYQSVPLGQALSAAP